MNPQYPTTNFAHITFGQLPRKRILNLENYWHSMNSKGWKNFKANPYPYKYLLFFTSVFYINYLKKMLSHSSSKSKNVIMFPKIYCKKKIQKLEYFPNGNRFYKKVFFYRWVHKRATRKWFFYFFSTSGLKNIP